MLILSLWAFPAQGFASKVWDYNNEWWSIGVRDLTWHIFVQNLHRGQRQFCTPVVPSSNTSKVDESRLQMADINHCCLVLMKTLHPGGGTARLRPPWNSSSTYQTYQRKSDYVIRSLFSLFRKQKILKRMKNSLFFFSLFRGQSLWDQGLFLKGALITTEQHFQRTQFKQAIQFSRQTTIHCKKIIVLSLIHSETCLSGTPWAPVSLIHTLLS